MKNSLLILLLLSIDFLYAQEKIISLPGSTVVVVKTINEFSGENLKTGQEVDCIVAMDVIIEDYNLIKAGTPVFCQVEDAESSGMVGSGGNLVISAQNTTTVDGKTVMLSGSFRVKGESSTGEKVAIGVILCPLALLFSGDEAVIPAGTQIRSFTIGETKVKIKE